MEKEYNKYLWSPKQPRVYGISPLTISGTPMPEEDVATSLKVENSQQRFQQNPIVKRSEQWEAQQKQREEEIAASKKWLELHPEDESDSPYTILERGKHQAIVDGKDPSYYEKMIDDGKQFTKGALGVLSLPYLGAATAGAYGYGASLGARGLFAGQGIYGLANKDGVRKTYNLTKDAIKGTGSWGDAAKSAGGDALNLAMIIPGTKFLTNVARAGYKPAIAADAINLATRTTKLPATEPLLNVGWAPKQTIGVTRAGEYDKMFYPNRYDVVHGNANPFGVWLQGKVGTSKPGLKAQIARDVMANRPAQYRGTVTLGKPIASVGEVSDRDALSRIIEGTGADGIIYNNVYDNGFNNNQVIHSFVKPELVDINKPAVVKYYGPTMGKSFAAKSNPNLIDLDTWGMPEYNQLAKKYGYKDWREMILSDKGDYNQEYKTLIKDQIRRIQADPQYNGKTIVVSNASLLKPDSGITFANTPLIPERGILAFRNHQRHPWESIEHGKQWWDSLQQKGTPLTIDNRFISDIELTPGNTTLFNTSFSPKGKTSYAFFERPSKLSEAERLGIPKHERDWDYQFFKSIKEENPALTSYIRAKHFAEQSADNKLTSLFFPKGRILDGDMLVSTDDNLFKYYQNNKKGLPIKLTHKSPNDFYVFDYTRQSKYPDGHFFFSMHNRPQFGKGKISKDFYIYDKNIKPISEYAGDDMHRINKNTGNYLLQELDSYSANSALIQDAIHNKTPHTIYGYDSGSNFTEGMYEFAVPRNTQMKLVDPITYDDNGHIIKLSKRDNFKNPDFRYKQGGILKRVESGKSGIHIKPENRGKFTALKKRTGKSSTWYKEHGTPAQKKMAVFALNAKKWKHK